MLNRLFIRRSGKARQSPLARALTRLAEFNQSSVRCTLLETAEGETADEDIGRAFLVKRDGQLLILNRAIYISVPDGIKAEDQDSFRGNGEVLQLWFLQDRVPRVVDCRVEERTRFPSELRSRLDPQIPFGYKLVPLGDVVKQDQRSSLRFSHQPGAASLPVYPQILFDMFVCKTDTIIKPDERIPPWIDRPEFKLATDGEGDDPVAADTGLFDPQNLVSQFKKSMLHNPSELRHVHVSKPYLDEKLDKSFLLELGFSDVLGLNSDEVGRLLHIKKPIQTLIKDRRDPHCLKVGDTLVLHYGSRAGRDGSYDYYELIAEISKGGLENISIRPRMHLRKESGLRVSLLDFCVNGVRFANSPDFMDYMFGQGHEQIPPEEQLEQLGRCVFLLNFYPKLRFGRDIDGYRPKLPKRISLLGQIVRGEIEYEDEEEKTGGHLRSFGVRSMYDPSEYSRDDFSFDRWEIIRPFRENRYFKEVHKSLNGLIAYLESQNQ
jgi:hypothetical protein